MSTVPLPTARLTVLREPPASAPEEQQCGALARGMALSVLPAAGTVSCVLRRGHESDHVSRPRAVFGRSWAHRW